MKKNRILLVISVILLVVAFIFWLISRNNDKQQAETIKEELSETTPPSGQVIQPEVQVPSSSTPVSELNNGVKIPTPPNNDQNEARKIATIFAERFGSYSSHSGMKNLEDLMPISTVRMQRFLESQMKQQTETDEADFYRLTTQVLVVEIENFNGQQATFNLMTRQQETRDLAINEEIFYRPINVELIKQNGDWLISGAYWQERQDEL